MQPNASLRSATIATAILVLAGFGVAADAAPEEGAVALAAPGAVAFWDGPRVVGAGFSPSQLADVAMRGAVADALCTPGHDCFDYRIHVGQAAWRLRVAVDAPWEGSTELDLRVRAPNGTEWFSTWSHDGTLAQRTHEAFVPTPEPGVYEARVYVFYAVDAQLRLRAKLEAAPTGPDAPRELLPDLRAEPPFSLAWTAPGALGVPTECTVDERVEDAPQRCLRFSFGWQNVGEGVFDVRLDQTATALGLLEGPVHQRVRWSDGTHRHEPGAGEYEWHMTHHHYHYRQFLNGELLRVLDATTGAVERVGDVRKIGACSHDWKMAEWHRFAQAPAGVEDSGLGCGFSGMRHTVVEPKIALSAGWLDVYDAGTPDNYVDFGAAPDGEYVIRIVMNPEGLIRESDTTNNVAYAHILVAGDVVTLLERGHGEGPWDPAREVRPHTW